MHIEESLKKAPSHGAYIAAKQKLNTLHQQRIQAERELTEIQAAGASKADAGSPYEAMVSAALEGKPIDLRGDSRRAEGIQQAHLKVQILKDAVARQEHLLRAERSRVVQELEPLLRPQHGRLVKDVAKALRALSDALKAEQEYRFAPELQDFDAAGLYPAEFRGDPRLFLDHSDGINWIADLKGAGYDV